MTIADTDVLIDFLAGVEPAAGRIAQELGRGALCTTAISRFELLSGARSQRQETAIRELLAALPALALDEKAADRAADVRRALERSGASIGMADSLIAGIALAHGAALLTRNRRSFERLAGLRLADPRQENPSHR
jgi:tRNA(fMet)-specific endonuclease VapC